ncbi:MAG: hypothetical protein IID46_02520 [Planctomycetes bacterium]|nr:hypothetical protein [Planctomycetota bacterium]
MKIAILSESPADEAAVKIFVEKILGQTIEVITRRVRSSGVDAVLNSVPPVLKALHYHRTADALVVALDSDRSPVHLSDHIPNDHAKLGCCSCNLHLIIEETLRHLRPIPNQPKIQTAVAVAVPAIEAWYQFGRDSNCTEAGWIHRRTAGVDAPAEIRKLKRAVYGTDRPGQALSKGKAIEHAERLAADLTPLEEYFPNSFGVFAQQVREWIVE